MIRKSNLHLKYEHALVKMRKKNDDVNFEIYSDLYKIGHKKLDKFVYKTIFDFSDKQHHINAFWKQGK